ncbi:right-handed parallel beta-helix repeat-containing protein [Halorussus halophilus]|uniref:right-handed parallel beta-helix repeat-containing protein n=1 Tax=Halorussus halophilus TaxID=2650975 RepID=UPI00130127CA|nr:right-handed parallel beta-helix repeat-containing protein [Halorussus halophilus]
MSDHTVLLVVSVLMSGLVAPGPVNQETGGSTPAEIDSCTTITESGHYALTADILNSTEATCIRIEADDVVLDGAGHTIDGNWSVLRENTGVGDSLFEAFANATEIGTANATVSQWAYHGVFVSESENVTISGLTVRDWVYGIAFFDVTDGNIRGVTTEQTATGVGLFQSTTIRTEAVESTNSTIGVVLDDVSVSSVTNSEINNSVLDGMELFETTGSSIVENTIRNTGRYDGLYLRNSSQNTVRDNDIGSNTLSGIALARGSNSNIVESNLVEQNGLNGILVRDNSVLNTVTNNTLEANAHSGVSVVDGANQNIVQGNVIRNTTGEDPYTAQVNYSAGIVINQSSRNQVTENWVQGNAYSGITLTNEANENFLTGNTILNTTGVEITVPETFRTVSVDHPAAIFIDRSSENVIRETYVRDSELWSYYSTAVASQNIVRNLTVASIRRYNVSTDPTEAAEFSFVEVATVVSFTGRNVALDANVTEGIIEPDWEPSRSAPRVNEVGTSENSTLENMSVRWYLRAVPTELVENTTNRRVRATTTTTTVEGETT